MQIAAGNSGAANLKELALTALSKSQVETSAANSLLSQLVNEAGRILREELDGLMAQFQDANPNFHEEYFAARTIVDAAASHVEHAKPAPQPVPVA